MSTSDSYLQRGLRDLRLALWYSLNAPTAVAPAGPRGPGPFHHPARPTLDLVYSDDGLGTRPSDGSTLAYSSAADDATRSRLIALVELAHGGDAEAFGQLYDHYVTSVYRFVYYRVGSVALAEDITSETFARALKGIPSFRWQGKDFGAWLTTIARNLTADHFKSARSRLETSTEDMGAYDTATEGPEGAVLASLTNQRLLSALGQLPVDQQECLVMRFLQGLSIAETARILGRSDGAVKQLQLRGVRNLAKLIPEELR